MANLYDLQKTFEKERMFLILKYVANGELATEYAGIAFLEEYEALKKDINELLNSSEAERDN